MTDTPTATAPARESVFVKGFLPGLVVGLIVGLAAGAFLPALTQEKPTPPDANTLHRAPSNVRDERPPDSPRAATPEDAKDKADQPAAKP